MTKVLRTKISQFFNITIGKSQQLRCLVKLCHFSMIGWKNHTCPQVVRVVCLNIKMWDKLCRLILLRCQNKHKLEAVGVVCLSRLILNNKCLNHLLSNTLTHSLLRGLNMLTHFLNIQINPSSIPYNNLTNLCLKIHHR